MLCTRSVRALYMPCRSAKSPPKMPCRKWHAIDHANMSPTRRHCRKWQPIDHHNMSSTSRHWGNCRAIDHHDIRRSAHIHHHRLLSCFLIFLAHLNGEVGSKQIPRVHSIVKPFSSRPFCISKMFNGTATLAKSLDVHFSVIVRLSSHRWVTNIYSLGSSHYIAHTHEWYSHPHLGRLPQFM